MAKEKAHYLLNPKTHTLHISGYCTYGKAPSSEWLRFNSRDEAIAIDGQAVGMCKMCTRTQERKLKENE